MAFLKVVVVTGASAGVGRATAQLFAKKGADVALIARGTDGLDAAQREMRIVEHPSRPRAAEESSTLHHFRSSLSTVACSRFAAFHDVLTSKRENAL